MKLIATSFIFGCSGCKEIKEIRVGGEDGHLIVEADRIEDEFNAHHQECDRDEDDKFIVEWAKKNNLSQIP